MKALVKAPHYNTGFIIIKELPEVINPFVIQFFATKVGCHRMEPYYIGSLVGDPFQDTSFAKKLERIRGKLEAMNFVYHNVWHRQDLRKPRRLDDISKYRRKMSRIRNEYNRKVEEAQKTLFSDERLKELQRQLAHTEQVIRERYNITEEFLNQNQYNDNRF